MPQGYKIGFDVLHHDQLKDNVWLEVFDRYNQDVLKLLAHLDLWFPRMDLQLHSNYVGMFLFRVPQVVVWFLSLTLEMCGNERILQCSTLETED